MLKGQFTPKSIIHIFLPSCSAIYPFRLFWCELPSFGDISCRDVLLFSDTIPRYSKHQKIHLKNSTTIMTLNDPQALS